MARILVSSRKALVPGSRGLLMSTRSSTVLPSTLTSSRVRTFAIGSTEAPSVFHPSPGGEAARLAAKGRQNRVTILKGARKVISPATPFADMADETPKDATPLEGARRRASTATSSFGVSRREGHDASVYYTSRLNEGLVSSRNVGEAEPFPEAHANTVLCGDSRTLPLPDNCVHLVVTSPPYNASKDSS